MYTADTYREAEAYGDNMLSVQASKFSYCTPRVSGLPIRDYTHVEIGLINLEGELIRPSEIGIEGFDYLFESGKSPVAGYVSQAATELLRQ